VNRAAVGLYPHFLREVDAPEGARILDVGTGHGYVPILFAKQDSAASVIGVDYAPR